MWGGWLTPRPGRFTPGKESRYPLYRGLGGPQGRSGRLQKNLASTGIRSPDRPVRSESLYRLSYRGPISQLPIPTKIYCFRLLFSLFAYIFLFPVSYCVLNSTYADVTAGKYLWKLLRRFWHNGMGPRTTVYSQRPRVVLISASSENVDRNNGECGAKLRHRQTRGRVDYMATDVTAPHTHM